MQERETRMRGHGSAPVPLVEDELQAVQGGVGMLLPAVVSAPEARRPRTSEPAVVAPPPQEVVAD